MQMESESDSEDMPVFAAETGMLKGQKIDSLYPDVCDVSRGSTRSPRRRRRTTPSRRPTR